MANRTAQQQGTTRADGTVVSRFDPETPHPARIYNYWLAGKDHFPADRRAAEAVIRHRPEVVAGARANRAFLARAVRYLAAERGFRQFLDIGAGLPAPCNTHEVAQQAAPGCAVVYADNDPLVLVYARALLTARPPGRCGYVDADLRDTATLLGKASRTLDFTRPAAVLLLAILHFIPDSDDPAGIVATLTSALAPGSYLVISHLTGGRRGRRLQRHGPHGGDPAHARTGHGPVRRPATGAARRGPGHRVAADGRPRRPGRPVCGHGAP